MSTVSAEFIHRFIPAADHSAQTPVLVLLHGTGGNEEDLLPLGRELAPNASLLGIRGNVLEHGMPRFFRRIVEGVFDEEDLRLQTHALTRFLERAAETYQLGTGKLTAVGYSNGANIAASLLLLEPAVLRQAVLFRSMVPLTPEVMPDLSGKSVWLSAGRQDPIVPAENTERLAEMLRGAGADVQLNWQNTGHGLVRSELVQAQQWLRDRL